MDESPNDHGDMSILQSLNGDEAAYRRAGMKAEGLAQEKIVVAGPVIRRLREKLGDKVVDGALERELREMARKAGL